MLIDKRFIAKNIIAEQITPIVFKTMSLMSIQRPKIGCTNSIETDVIIAIRIVFLNLAPFLHKGYKIPKGKNIKILNNVSHKSPVK